MSDPVTRLNAALEGRYAIERELGEGGMATVYLAKDLKHSRKVALKVLKPELAAVVGAERFLAEIKVTANLTHPNILPLHDSGEAGSFLFYVMPYIEGETLGDRLERESQLPVDEAVSIATEVADALQAAHEQGIIHRDIKPANILLSRGRPLVADFGIALAVSAAGGGRLTETGLSLGTPHYMSPEQATGDQIVGPSTDIYSLGSVLYEMLVGEPPYTGSNAQAILGKIIQGKPVSARDERAAVPANVDAALRKALEKLAADRFTSAQEFARAIGDPGFRYGELAAADAGPAAGPWKRLSLATTGLAAVFALTTLWSFLRPDIPGPVTRVSVQIPEEQSIAPSTDAMALSPDGSLLVYQGVSDEGPAQLWVRPWNALYATPIHGTEGTFSPPDISPDGQEVAFVSGSSFRVVPIQGGVTRTLSEEGGCCPTWSPDGVWLYYSNPPAGLRRVPAGGGSPEVITEVATDAGDQTLLYPDVLPGGEGVVFQIRGVDGSRIQAVDVETREVKDLTPGAHPRYSPTGHLLFLDEDATLLAAPFDVESLELTGPAVPVIEGVARFAVSPAGTLVYNTGISRDGGFLTPVWVERDGTSREIDPGWRADGTTRFSSVALSRDGTRLAISLLDDGGTYDLWVKQLDSGPLSRVTFEGTQNYRATWSPDGQSLMFLSNRNEMGNAASLWTKRADGGGTATLVLDRELSLREGLHSPDGEWLVFRDGGDYRASDSGDVYAIRPGRDSTATALVATDFDENSMALSPDGRWMTYVSNATGRSEVYVSPFPDAGSGRQLVSTAGGSEPMWAHSGRELFYRNGADELVAAQVTTGPTFTVGQQEVLFALAGYYSGRGHPQYDVTPDDQRFVMLRLGDEENAELVLVLNFFEELKERVPN